MSLWVKICGLATDAAVDAAREAGADAVGFVFAAGSPRTVTPALARALCRGLPARIARVAVTRHPAQADIDALLTVFQPDLLQTDAADLATLVLPATLALLPVLRTGAAPPPSLPSRCLYEGARSGAGEAADWEAAARLARRTELVLAGGLTPASVALAIGRVHPAGVDVSSGVESAPGRKDPALIASFISAARAAAATHLHEERER
jgi:phosphoribosylanthranilate isomerase